MSFRKRTNTNSSRNEFCKFFSKINHCGLQALWRSRCGSIFHQVTACRLFGAKSKSGLILTNCHLGTKKWNSVIFESKSSICWRKCIWKRRLQNNDHLALNHDDVIKWKHLPRYWPFVRGIHQSRWIPHTKASDAELWWFLWSAVRINGWVNKREAGDLRRHHGHYDVIVMAVENNFDSRWYDLSQSFNFPNGEFVHYCSLQDADRYPVPLTISIVFIHSLPNNSQSLVKLTPVYEQKSKVQRFIHIFYNIFLWLSARLWHLHWRQP